MKLKNDKAHYPHRRGQSFVFRDQFSHLWQPETLEARMIEEQYWPFLNSVEQEIAEAKVETRRTPRETYWLKRYGVLR